MDVGRKQLGAATRHLLEKACFSVQLPLRTPDGDPDGELDWVCGDFGKLLDDFTHDCKEYGDLIRELHHKKPCTIQQPWSLVIYFDEATPGDPLRLDHVRKSMCVYVSIKELGPTMLKHERCWIPCGVLRANQIKRVPGKWSACFKLWLRGFFVNPRSSLRYGVSLRALKGNSLFFRIGNILADADGLRQLWCHRGARAVFPCFDCFNVCNIGARSIVRPGDELFVDIQCCDDTKFRHLTDLQLRQRWDTLGITKATCTDTVFENKSQSYGLKSDEHAVFSDHELRPFLRHSECNTHDPTHTLYSNGICHTEVNKLLP
jgi:hypothetical protein